MFFFNSKLTAQDDALVNHDCPGTTPWGCKDFEESVAIDLSAFLDIPDACYMAVKYKYRICFNDNTYTFQVIKNEKEEYAFFDAECKDKFDAAVKGNLNASIYFDIFLSDALLQHTAFLLGDTFTQGLIDKYNCDKGVTYLTGTYYYGYCSQAWWGSSEGFIKVGNKIFPKKVVKYNVTCGGNCCFREQTFCVLSGSVEGNVYLAYAGPPTTKSNSIGTTCSQPTGGVPFVPSVTWFYHTDCYSVCDKEVVKAANSTNSNQITPLIRLESANESLDINNFTIYDNGNIKINFKSIFSGKVEVLDTDGRIILSQKLNNVIGDNELISSDLSKGIYFITVSDKNTSKTKKFVKVN